MIMWRTVFGTIGLQQRRARQGAETSYDPNDWSTENPARVVSVQGRERFVKSVYEYLQML